MGGWMNWEEVTERLLDELIDTGICVECFIDKNADSICVNDMKVVYPDNIPLSVDMVVVASIHYYEDIKNE